ncbi:hypothetical protein ACLK19_16945 [Escherichia coli]
MRLIYQPACCRSRTRRTGHERPLISSRSLSVSEYAGRSGGVESIEECWFAHKLLACFYYNKRSYDKAITLWQRS